MKVEPDLGIGDSDTKRARWPENANSGRGERVAVPWTGQQFGCIYFVARGAIPVKISQ
jgi:hypothetical protein